MKEFMNKDLRTYLNQLTKKGYRFHTESIFSRNDFYYLFLKKDKGFRLLMNGEEQPEDIENYLRDVYNYEL